MGTLGCIYDMLRRDKENRDLRRRNRERIHETHNRLLNVRQMQPNENLTIERFEEIQNELRAKETLDRKRRLRFSIRFLVVAACFLLLLYLILFV